MSDTSDLQADETINLDDDSLLSPDTEEPEISSPLERLNSMEDSTDQLELDDPRQDELTENENLETVQLETPSTLGSMEESIYLGSDSVPDLTQSIQTVSSLVSDDQGPEEVESDETRLAEQIQDPSFSIGGNQKDDTEDSEETPTSEVATDAKGKVETPGDITKYFISSGEGDDFFDTISTDPLTQQTAEEADHYQEQEDGTEHIRVRTTSTSGVHEEAIPVDFEEAKGQGLRFIASTDSVRKFFTADTVAADKSMFESFTAGSGDSGLGSQLTVPSVPEQAAAGGSIASGTQHPQPSSTVSGSVPQTPPIPPGGMPLTPPIPSPLPGQTPEPSPMHHPLISTDARSRSTSQTSPMPSPSHSTSTHSEMSQPPSLDNLGLAATGPGILQEAFHIADDVFSASLSMSDSDRSHDAWIPNEATRQTLVSMVTSPPGAFIPEQDQLTKPGLLFDEPLGDPVKDLVQRFMGDQEALKRVTLTADSVSQDEAGLRQLIKGECLRSAVDLTGILLSAAGQGVDSRNQITKHTPYTLQLWFTRIALLMKLRLYSHAESECQAFGNLDQPDLYYEFYPDVYPGRRGSMVPFTFRVLYAEIPQYLGKAQESLDRLYYVHAITKKIVGNLESGLAEDGSMLQLNEDSRRASRELWESREVRLLYSIGNCLLHIKDYATAIDVYEDLLKKDEPNQDKLLCGIGRIYLQMGDVRMAQQYFDRVQKPSDESNNVFWCRNLMNKGFVALGANLFAEAHQFFKQAVEVNPSNAVAVNNMAVCSLYMGKLREALSTLEALVHEDPARFLQEGLLFNLCTLYELESSHAMHKKQTLLDLVCKHKGNGFNTACLKMT